MRTVAAALLMAGALLGCSQAPTTLPQSGTLSGAELRQVLQSGDIWCYNYEPATQSCSAVERVRQVTQQGFTLNQLFMFQIPEGTLKMDSIQIARFQGDRACVSWLQQVGTMRSYVAGSTAAELTGADQQVPADLNTQLVNVIRQEATRAGQADETCFGWRVLNRAPLELQELEFVDGVQQPDEEPSVIRFFPAGTTTIVLRPV